MTIEKDFLIEYKDAQAKAKYWKERENKMRVQLADELLKHRRAGTHHFYFNNIHLKGVKKYNISPDTDVLNALWDDMSVEEQSCFKFSPRFVNTEYKKLLDTSVVDQCIVTKPAMPTFTVEISEEDD